jgi:hypothetical protein
VPLFNAGNAYLQILPSFRGIERLMQRETAKLARQVDDAVAKSAAKGLEDTFGRIDAGKISRGASKAGDKWASEFEQSISRRVKEVADGLPEFEPKVKLNRFDRAIAQTKRSLGELANTKIGPTGDVGLDQLGSKLDAMVKRMTRLADETKFVDQRIRLLNTASQASLLKDLVDDARKQGLTDGRVFGGAFAIEAKQKIASTLRNLPEINLDADVSPAERAVAALRAQLEALGEKSIGVDIDRDRFAQELAYVSGQLESLARDPKSITLKYDLDKAAAQLREFGEKIAPTLDPVVEQAGNENGERWAGAYVEAATKRLAAAIRTIPNIPLTARSDDAERKLAAIRVEMESLSNKRIGIDIRATEAQAKITELRARLDELDNDDVKIDVRTNAAAAAAELALITREAKSADQSFSDFARDAGITMSRLGYLIAIGASVGSIIAPAAAAAAVAVTGIGTAALSAVAGFGVLTLGLYGVADAVKKIDAYQQDANKSAKSFSQAQNQIITATEQVRDAEQNLAFARKDAADGAVESQRRIVDAQRNVAKVQRDVAESIADARKNERESIKDLSRARADAHDQVERAVEAEAEAQRDSTRAIEDQKKARDALSQALKDAARDLKELQLDVKQNQNDIEQATTSAMKAKVELDKIMSNPRATEIERRQALETYQDKLLQIEDLKLKQEELAQQQAAADKDGVESTDRVKKAREQVATADERAADAARRLEDARKSADKARVDAADRIAKAEDRVAKAHDAVSKAQSDGAERIADAQRQVADAQRAAAKQQQQSQRQIQNGVEALTRAQRALAQANTNAGVAGGDAFDTMNDALNSLSPAGRDFAKWLYSIKPKLDELRQTAQQGLLPGLQDSLEILIGTYFPAFDKFVGKIAKGLGDMFRATALIVTQDPQWRAFFSFMDDVALSSLENMWVASLNLAKGVTNIVRALHPLAAPMGAGLVDLTERFARWSDQLQSSNGFQRFTEYAARVGPKVVELIKDLVEFVGRLVIAMAPLGEFILDAVTNVVEWINSWDIDTLSSVVDIVAILGTGIVLLTGFVRTVRFVTETWNAISLVAAKAQGILATAVARYNEATVGAVRNTGLLNGRMFASQAAGAAGAAGMGLMEAAAGPLGAALAILGGIFFLTSLKSQNAEADTDELAGSLEQLGDKYREAANAAQLGSSDVADSFKKIVAQNDDLKKAVVNLTNLGLGIDQIAAAAGGNAGELDAVIQRIDIQMGTLLKTIADAQNAFDENGIDIGATMDQVNALGAIKDKLQEAADKARLDNQAMAILNSSTKETTASTQILTPAQQALADAHKVLADSTSTAKEKFDALTKAQDVMRQSTIDAIEAEESFNGGILSLQDSVNSAKEAEDKHATSLALNTSQGLRNRDMIENLIQSADKMYDADVSLNGVTADAVKKGQDHYKQIRDVAKALNLNEAQTNDLIKAYGKVPKDISTAVSMDPNSFNNVYTNLQRMLFMQDAAKRGLSPAAAEAEWKRQDGARKYQRYVPNKPGNVPGFAAGGGIGGIGGPTSDNQLIWASPGEFMQPADAVDYYGPHFMEAVRRKAIPRQLIPGFATGGAISRPTWNWPIDYKVPELDFPSMEQIFSGAISGFFGSPLGNMIGGRGWQWQMDALHRVFPKLALISGYRPGAHTLSGNLSWHARGRAVDVPALRNVAEYIYKTYGHSTLELITPWRDLMLYKGKPHKFSRDVEAQHGVFGNNAHIHWAYDSGGILPPGMTSVWNGTGQPEAVLTNQQWQAIDALTRTATTGGGNTYKFEFRDTTLDAGRLRVIQEREAIRARDGRAR